MVHWKTTRTLAAACAGLLVFAAACGGDDKPKASASLTPTTNAATSATTTTGAGTGTAEPATPSATFTPEPPPTVTAAPTGATELEPGEYKDLTATSLTCDGNNMIVLRTRTDTFYLQTLVRQNFSCENVKTNIVTAAGLKGDQANVVDGKALEIKYVKLEQSTAAGSYQANLNWKDSGSMLVIVVSGWRKKA